MYGDSNHAGGLRGRRLRFTKSKDKSIGLKHYPATARPLYQEMHTSSTGLQVTFRMMLVARPPYFVTDSAENGRIKAWVVLAPEYPTAIKDNMLQFVTLPFKKNETDSNVVSALVQ